jgi:putative Ca2+/H+ antiporter (TMEM165/GDT1 family)
VKEVQDSTRENTGGPIPYIESGIKSSDVTSVLADNLKEDSTSDKVDDDSDAKDPLDDSTSAGSSPKKDPETPKGSNDQHRSFLTSSLMIMVSEIGDKTFLIAAILSMTHPRLTVFSAALSALLIMSILSAILGNILPSLVSRFYTQLFAGFLFLIFGIRMMMEGLRMSPEATTSDEYLEVAAEIKAREEDSKGHFASDGGLLPRSSPRKPRTKQSRQRWIHRWREVLMAVMSPIFLETFVLTFLAEWGDRSQIATIVMAASGVRVTFLYSSH